MIRIPRARAHGSPLSQDFAEVFPFPELLTEPEPAPEPEPLFGPPLFLSGFVSGFDPPESPFDPESPFESDLGSAAFLSASAFCL